MLNEELLKKIDISMIGNNDYLIGDIEFEDEELDEMQNYFRNRVGIIRSASDLDEIDLKLFIVYVVNKLREWDKEWPGNKFWDRVAEMFEQDANVSKILGKPLLNDKLAKILEKSNRIVFVSDSGNRQFAQTFLFQAFATKESMLAFVQLAWNIYINEDLLDCDYPDSDIEFCEYIIDNLKSKLSNVDSDELVQFGGATYSLKAALKYGIFQNKKTAYLLDRIFRYIYRVDYNNEDICDNHLGLLVTDKVNELKQLLKDRKKRKANKTAIRGKVYSFDKLRPQYRFNDNPSSPRVFLAFPKLMLIKSEKHYDYYGINIYNNGIKINNTSSDYCYAKHNEDITIFNSIEIDITDYIYKMRGKINFEIHITTNIKGEQYSTKETLYREYLLFKSVNEVRGNCRQGDYFLITTPDFELNKVTLIDNEGLYSLNQCIHSIATVDGDCILGDSFKTIFGSQKKEQIQFREDPKSVDNIFIIKDGFEMPIYKEVSDLMISLKNDDIPNSIIIRHLYLPFDSTKVQCDEIRVNELFEEGIRFVYSCNQYGLSRRGYHEVQIDKLTGTGLKSIISEPLKYCIDKKVKVITNNKNMYLHGNFNIEIHYFDAQYSILTRNDSIDDFIEISSTEKLHIIFPYFEWQFGTFFDAIIHTKPLNASKPLFIDDIYTSSETIEINSYFNVLKVVFRSNQGKDIELKPANKGSTKFKLAEFLQSYREKGAIVAILENELELLLFSLTNEPYVVERIIDDCFNYEDGKCFINCSKFFIHDRYDYYLNIKMYNTYSNDVIEIKNINPNMEFEFRDEKLVDGEYELEISWAKIVGGLVDEEHDIIFDVPPVITIGHPLLIEFNKITSLMIDKTKILDNGKLENIKFKDYLVSGIRFIGYTEVDELKFKGKLKSPDFKSIDVEFIVRGLQWISQLQSNGKMVNYDKNKRKLTLDEVIDNKVYQMFTLHVKYGS